MSETKTFAGIRVDGYGQSTYHHNKVQRPASELEPLFTAALAHPEVLGIRWRQYTPYFNDGEPCHFGVNDPTFLVDISSEDDGDYEDGYVELYDPILKGGQPSRYSYQTGKWEDYGETYPQHPAYDDLYGVSVLCTGEFDDALAKLFGDHVKVTVTRESIIVDDYDHD